MCTGENVTVADSDDGDLPQVSLSELLDDLHITDTEDATGASAAAACASTDDAMLE